MTEENTGPGQGPQGLSQADEEPGGPGLGLVRRADSLLFSQLRQMEMKQHDGRF